MSQILGPPFQFLGNLYLGWLWDVSVRGVCMCGRVPKALSIDYPHSNQSRWKLCLKDIAIIDLVFRMSPRTHLSAPILMSLTR